jgi:hypothetical protein
MSTKEDIRKHLVCLLGGRAAELIVFGELMTGSAFGKQSDVGRASFLAATFPGSHGRFWRNCDCNSMTVNVKLRGTYGNFK